MQYHRTAALLALFVAACAGGQRDAGPSSPEPTQARSGELRFAGQPDAQSFAALAGEGIEVVINLREPDEMNFDNASVAAAAGLQYYAVPISRSGPGFDAAAIQQLHALVEQHRDDDILMYCASGNRVAGWYATYLVERRGFRLEEALAQARGRGMRPGLEPRVREYLDDKPGT